MKDSGAYAEYARVPASELALNPESIDRTQAVKKETSSSGPRGSRSC